MRPSDSNADFLDRADNGVDLERLARLGVLEHRGLEGAELTRDRVPFLRGLGHVAADAPPIAAASSIAAEQKARTSGSSRMRSPVAPVSADTGFIVRLPQSLYQISCWRGARNLESGVREQLGELRQSQGYAPVRLADDQAVTHG